MTFVVRQSDVLRCPHSIVDPKHFSAEAGKCPCYDPADQEMAEWGYEWSDDQGMWIVPEEDE